MAATVILGALDSSQVLSFVLFDLVVIVVVGGVCGWLARRVGQPTVVGQILGGVLLGPTILGPAAFTWLAPWGFLHCDSALGDPAATASITDCFFPPQARSALAVIGQIGLVLFMLQVGTVLDHGKLRTGRPGIVAVSIGAIVVPVALGLAIAPVLYTDTFTGPAEPSQLAFALMIGALLAVTAFPVLAYILQEKRLDTTRMGTIAISAAAVVTVLMFLFVASANGVATNEGVTGFATKVLVTALYIGAMVVVVRTLFAPMGRRIEESGTVDTLAVTAILLTALVSSLVTERLGLSVVPGAFLAGAILPARAIVGPAITAKLQDLTLIVLIPVFLTVSGLATNLRTLGLSALPAIALFLAMGIAGKWLGASLAGRMVGLTWREGYLLGALFNCRGLLPLVVALIGLQTGVISTAMQGGAVLMALITTAMTGPLVDRLVEERPAPATVAVAAVDA